MTLHVPPSRREERRGGGGISFTADLQGAGVTRGHGLHVKRTGFLVLVQPLMCSGPRLASPLASAPQLHGKGPAGGLYSLAQAGLGPWIAVSFALHTEV